MQVCGSFIGPFENSHKQELIHSLHAPVVDNVVEHVKNSYTDELLGLPYPELPVVSVTCPSYSST